MKYCGIFVVLVLIIVSSFADNPVFTKVAFRRSARGIKDWNIFAKTSTTTPPSSTVPQKLPNNLEIGQCEDGDKVKLKIKVMNET